MTSRFKYPALAISLVALAALGVAGCDFGQDKPAAAAPQPPKVLAASPTVRTITEWDDYTGRFAAVESVEVRARVSGYLTDIHFKDGQLVKKGDLLFTIDRRPFALAADSAAADLKVAEAALDFAKQELQRAASLLASKNVPERTYDERTTGVRQAEARVLAAQSALSRAKLNLEFTEVRSPVSGRIDRHTVSIGNLVNGGETDPTLLTTIVSLDPIHVVFDVDQNAYLRYVRAAQAGIRPSSRDYANPVRIGLPDDNGFPYPGTMDFVSNQIDRDSATIRVRAVVPNKDMLFTPGLFARIQLVGRGSYEAVMIPDEAVAVDQASRVIFVVKDGKTELRNVKLGPIVDGLRVVREGLSANEIVVTSGLQRIRSGQQVAVETSNPANPVKTARIASEEKPQ